MPFGLGGGFDLVGGPKGVLGGLSLIGSAFVRFQAEREQQKAASEEKKRLERERQAAQIRDRRDREAREDERRRQVGSIRARLGAQGLDLTTGSARRLIDLTEARFDQDDEDAEEFRRLERQGFTSAIGAARRARSAAGVNQLLLPALSLVRGFGGRA